MLVLSRNKDESIMIGDNIEIIIVDVRGDKVRLGIEAPKDVIVHRKEIWDAIQRENAEKKKTVNVYKKPEQQPKPDVDESAGPGNC